MVRSTSTIPSIAVVAPPGGHGVDHPTAQRRPLLLSTTSPLSNSVFIYNFTNNNNDKPNPTTTLVVHHPHAFPSIAHLRVDHSERAPRECERRTTQNCTAIGRCADDGEQECAGLSYGGGFAGDERGGLVGGVGDEEEFADAAFYW